MKYYLAIAIIVLSVFIFAQTSFAQAQKVDYQGEVIVDADLDGLTDKGEEQIFQTDPALPDTDGDGFFDGVEILNGTDPLDFSDPIRARSDIISQAIDRETPWAWYVARAAGFTTYVFLWLTIFLGLAIRNPLLKKIIAPVYSFNLHCFLAAMAVFWGLVHGTSLLFDHAFSFGFRDLLIPFYAKILVVNPNHLALGIMALYLMAVMTATSYLRRHINHRLWRILHFLNPLAFILVVFHGYLIGTDTKNFWIGGVFLLASFLLVVLYLSSLGFVIWNKFRAPSAEEILNNSKARL